MIGRLAIVGVGLIGGSIGLAAKVRGAAKRVIGIEANQETWADALRLGAVDEITNDLAAGVAGADLVILAVPVRTILELLPKLPSLIGDNTIVTDVGSVKTAIAEAGFAALGDRFIPGHPMAGSEKGGVISARADLFEGAIWALFSSDSESRSYVDKLRRFVTSLGSSAYYMDVATHDDVVALTSHLPHVIAYTLSSQLHKHRDRSLLVAGSWRSATRVAESPPELWAQIATQNAVPLAQTLRTFADELNTIATALETGDTGTVRERFTAGHEAKLREREKQY